MRFFKGQLRSLRIRHSAEPFKLSKGDVFITYNFDEQETSKSYLDQSGNDHTVKFNRAAGVRTNYPFATEHPSISGTVTNPVYPELFGKDRSARTYYNASTIGYVSSKENINLADTGLFTMEGWINLEGFAEPTAGAPVGGTIWYMGSAGTAEGTSVFALKYTAEGVVQGQFNALSQPGGTRTFTTEFTLSLNSWTHIAYVKASNRVRIYVNGELIYTFIESGISSRPMPINLTACHIAHNIKGRFNDFRLSNVELTPSQLGYFNPCTPVPLKGTTLLVQ
ncbi:MAG: LamG domain-containing protein [Bacteroidales bacterium]|nr:LamG domain-containing protein [Bacteroidales bacterium]